MKSPNRLSSTLISLLGIFVFSNCSEDLDILTYTPSVPVIYCIMDPLDSVYRVLLTRTFAGKASAAELAQNPENLGYMNARVTLEAWHLGYPVWSTTLIPEPASRDSGFFSSEAGCGFKSQQSLTDFFGSPIFEGTDSLFEYLRLVVDYDSTQEPAYARIPSKNEKPRIEFPIYTTKMFNLLDTIPFHIDFYSSPACYYDLRCRIKYSETEDYVNFEEKSFEFNYRRNIQIALGGLHSQIIRPDDFFRLFAQNFPESGEVAERRLISVDFILLKGSETLKTYMNTYYSDNDHGYELWNCFHNGIGLFALKSYSALNHLKMEPATLDSLALGRYTKQLNFNRWAF